MGFKKRKSDELPEIQTEVAVPDTEPKKEHKPVSKNKKEQPRKPPVTKETASESTDHTTVYYASEPMTAEHGLGKKEIKKQRKFFNKNKSEVVLVKMELGNGQFREFLANDLGGFFYYKRNQYVFDYSMKYFLIDRNIWAYDYHEFLSIPLRKELKISEDIEKKISDIVGMFQAAIDTKRKSPIKPTIDINKIKTIVENSELVDVEASLNPTTLKRFTDSEVIKQVLQGTMLGKVFKIMFVLIIVLAVFGLINLLLTLYQSGIFERLIGTFQ